MTANRKKSKTVAGVLSAIGVVSLLALAGCNGGTSSGGNSSRGTVTTVTGAADSGNTDGTLVLSRFNNPVNVAVDTTSNIFVADFDNNRIRRIGTDGNVTTIVNQANFTRPFGMAFTPDGRLFVQTDSNDLGGDDNTTGTIWIVDIAAKQANVVARNLGRPRGIAALNNTQLVLSDVEHHDVRLLDLNSGIPLALAGQRDTPGFANGQGNAARFDRPYGVAITSGGSIIVADQNNDRIRLITAGGQVVTLAGSVPGYRDGNLQQALFNNPQDVDIDVSGNIYISDNGNHRIRFFSNQGAVSTIAGNSTAGFADGSGAQASFFGQEGIALSRDGLSLFVADGNSGNGGNFNRIRRVLLR